MAPLVFSTKKSVTPSALKSISGRYGSELPHGIIDDDELPADDEGAVLDEEPGIIRDEEDAGALLEEPMSVMLDDSGADEDDDSNDDEDSADDEVSADDDDSTDDEDAAEEEAVSDDDARELLPPPFDEELTSPLDEDVLEAGSSSTHALSALHVIPVGQSSSVLHSGVVRHASVVVESRTKSTRFMAAPRAR